MAARNFLPRCIAFYNRIPIDSLKIHHSNAMHLDKKFLAAIFSVIVYSLVEQKDYQIFFNENSYLKRSKDDDNGDDDDGDDDDDDDDDDDHDDDDDDDHDDDDHDGEDDDHEGYMTRCGRVLGVSWKHFSVLC